MESLPDISSELPHLPRPEGFERYLLLREEIVSTSEVVNVVTPVNTPNGSNGSNGSNASNGSIGTNSTAPDIIKLAGNISSQFSDAMDSKGFCCGFGDSKPKGVSMPVHRESHTYNMNHPKRGKAVIFNHQYFHPSLGLSVRSGTEKDKDNLKTTLGNLGYEVKAYDDLAYHDILDTVKALCLEDHGEHDSLLIAILSHGDTNILYARDHSYKFELLWQSFTADRVPTLAGKPKIFFVQACQGDQLDGGTKLVSNRSEVDSKPQSYRIPNYADFLICYSTFPGHYAWRNTTNGSWFVQAICEILSKHANKKDLLSMMTMVAREVAVTFESNTPSIPHMHQKKQIPFITSTLIRDIYFSTEN